MIALTDEEIQCPTPLTPLKVLWMAVRFSLDELESWEGGVRFDCRWLGLGSLVIFGWLVILAARHIIIEMQFIRSDACWDDDDLAAWREGEGTQLWQAAFQEEFVPVLAKCISGIQQRGPDGVWVDVPPEENATE